MRLGMFVCVVAMTCLVGACGGRSQPGIPPGARKDAGQADSGKDSKPPVKDTWVPLDGYVPGDSWWPKDTWQPKDTAWPKDVGACNKMGQPCSGACCPGLQCAPLKTGVQVCTRACTPDDPKTPLINEDNCSYAFKCSDISPPGKSYRCLQKCDPRIDKATCPKGIACHPQSTQLSANMTQAVCAYPVCTSGKQCPVRLKSSCNPAVSAPQCTSLGSNAFCAPDPSGYSTGHCALPGACHPVSGLCDAHKLGKASAVVGGICKDDRDCGGGMRCLMEQAASVGLVKNRNGYCIKEGCVFAKGLPHRACASGSTCSRLYYGGVCYRTCDLKSASTCRGYAGDKHGDYECRAWNNLAVSSGAVTKSPVCEPGHALPCTMFASTSLNCSHVGLQGNPTGMQCREAGSGKVLGKYSAAGYCLDTTASGK